MLILRRRLRPHVKNNYVIGERANEWRRKRKELGSLINEGLVTLTALASLFLFFSVSKSDFNIVRCLLIARIRQLRGKNQMSNAVEHLKIIIKINIKEKCVTSSTFLFSLADVSKNLMRIDSAKWRASLSSTTRRFGSSFLFPTEIK